MSTSPPVLTFTPRRAERRALAGDGAGGQPQERAATGSEDLRLFALSFAAGFLFLTIYLS